MSEKQQKNHLPWWQETLIMVAVALVLSVLLKTFLVQAFYIPSESMEPTLLVNDKILVEKPSYWSGEPERGDIVVFRDSAGWLSGPDEKVQSNPLRRALEIVGLVPSGGHLIKRVIGVGGDEVACCNDRGQMTVNGVALAEPYLNQPGAEMGPSFRVEVPQGYLWVQGDNRNNSADSRAHMGEPGGGFVPVDQVVGKTWVRIWPRGRFGKLPTTDVFDELNK